MIRCVIISPETAISEKLGDTLGSIAGVGLLRTITGYPVKAEFTRFLRAHAPQVAFVSISSMADALDTARTMAEVLPGIQVIAIGQSFEQSCLLEVMRAGIREFLVNPFERQAVMDALARVRDNLEAKPIAVESTDLLYSFLPAKAGVGATSLALNTAFAISQIDETKTFLGDFDLSSGMVRFMLKLDNGYSVIDAAERSTDLDENFWPQLVTPRGSLDVMHAGRLNPNFRIEPLQMRRVLEFARRNYKVICADLSGNLEKYSLELMHESKRIFLVCTPEVSSLYLAREKLNFLRSLDLGDRVSLLLNRKDKRNMVTLDHVEELMGIPVEMSFPNDYRCIHESIVEGRPVPAASPLGVKCLALATSMLTKKPTPTTANSKKRFIEYFSLTPARYTIAGR